MCQPQPTQGDIMNFLPWIPVIIAILEVVKEKWHD